MVGECVLRNLKRLFVLILCMYVFFELKVSVKEIDVKSNVYLIPANTSFHDDEFYRCIVNSYNSGVFGIQNKDQYIGYDQNLTDEQLASIEDISCSFGYDITDVSGIEKLVNLKKLQLSGNRINSIDLSNNTKLESIDLGGNQLSEIDLSHNVKLETIYLDNNQLTEIDLSNNVNLYGLNLSYNQLSNIDLSHNNKLSEILLDHNQLTEIDLSMFPLLQFLSLRENELSSINLSHNSNLLSLDLDGNSLSSIDLSNNVNLTELDLGFNSLVGIDLGKNILLQRLYLSGNKLTSVDLSNNVDLINLSLSQNELTSIDLRNNVNLTELDLGYNQLTNIDLSHNTKINKDLDLYPNRFLSDKNIYIYYGDENNLYNLYDFSSYQSSVILPDNISYNLRDDIFPSNLFVGRNYFDIYYDLNGLEKERSFNINFLINVVKASSNRYYIDEDDSYIYVGDDSFDDIIANISFFNDDVTGSIVDGKYVVKYGNIVLKSFNLIRISSDNYDLSKTYLYDSIDNILNNINYDDSILNVGLNLINNKIEIKYKDIVVDSYDFVNIISSKYDLSKDSVNVSDNDISSFLSNINCTNCRAYVYDGNNKLSEGAFGDNNKLRIMYGSEIIKSFNLNFAVSSVLLNTNSVKLNLDSKRTFQLVPIINPVNAENKDVVWESSDSSVVSVDNGVITAQGYGEADITVRTVDGDFTDTCHVVVSDIITHTVSFNDRDNSYDVEFTDGENIVFKTDLERDGYRLVGWRYNNIDYSLSDTLIMPDHDIELEAIWDVIIPDIDSYTISDGFMSGISLNTDISEFNLGIDSMYEVKITNNKEHLKNSGLIATGDNVSIYLDDELVASYKVVVKGDINGDGKNNAHDISRLYKQIRGRISMDECYIRASDVNGDTKANAHDISKMYKYIRGRISKL